MKIYEKSTSGNIEDIKRELSRKKRILFLVDNHNWCWTTSCQNMIKHLPEFDCTIATANEWKQRHNELLANCDLVYMRGYPHIFLAGLPELDKPYLWTLSTGGAALPERIAQSLPYSGNASGCIVQNKQALIACHDAGIKNIHFIPNGIDTEHFQPSNVPQLAVAGFAGNNSGAREDMKGTEFAKQACNALNLSYREVTLDNRLTYDQMPEFYNSIRFYIQPSISEGCSNSVMEAMACGKVCFICSGVGYHGEICNSEVVFVDRNAKDIEYKLNYLLDNPEMYNEISMKAREFALKHDWKLMIKHHRNAILQAINEYIPPEKSVKTCQYCRYCVENHCRRFPPTIQGSRAEFPKVNNNIFCGEWVKK